MAHLPLPIVSLECYLNFESRSSEKHEFIDGYMVAMAGGSSAHSTITVNVSTAISRRMDDSPCRPFSSDMRVRVDDGSTWVYPDFAVTCEEPRFIDTKPETLPNPTFLVEVLSPSTTAYDRDLKAPRYRACPSVREFLLISQTPVEVEHWFRGDGNEWRMDRITDPDVILKLDSLGVEVPAREFYRRVEGF